MATKEVFEISKSFESDCRKINPFQYSIIHSRIDEYKTGLNKAFFSLARGPSASTDRHFENTSQYPKNIVSILSRLFYPRIRQIWHDNFKKLEYKPS